MTKLSVNLNKIALVRNSRGSGIPSVTRAARICIDAGADGITVHPRPDERHIRPQDVYDLKGLLTVEFNIEGNPFEPKFLELVRAVRPTQCTLVPDARHQLTSDHGWDLVRDGDALRPIIAELRNLGVRVSLFVDPVPDAMPLAKAVGADRVELYTGPYAEAFQHGQREAAWGRYAAAARSAREAELGVNAGHDLNQDNLRPFLEHVPGVLEVSIGHALISDALEWGLAETVRRYRALCRQA
uniref:Pyridoxine 5'-phosphate synthase n=1 Tax=Schlesneria paludicola TaxID=360056 RepID=A0A7C4QQG5_9PLAN